MTPFVLRAHLRTPIVMGGFITLDALLMAVLETGDVSHLVQCHDDLYSASSAFLVDAATSQTASFVASLRPDHSPHWLKLLQSNTLDGDLRIGLSRQREGGNIINAYPAQVARAVEWYAIGRAEAVLDTVRNVPFIGKRRASGYGEVTHWEVEPGELDGLVGYGGEPLRPIPTDRWTHGGDWVPIEAAWKAPYWDVRNRTRCFAPSGV